MRPDILTDIHNQMRTFSKGQRRIADYILTSYDKAAFMTASVLGKIAQVSESTVVRFAAQLGYEGYPEMQRALQDVVRSRLTSVQRMDAVARNLDQGDIPSAIMAADAERIRDTDEHLDREAFAGAVDAIVHAKRVYILGVRSSAALASFMGFYLHYILEDVRVVTTASISEMLGQVIRTGPGDVAIGITFPRYSTATHNAMVYCREAGARTIAITDGPSSPTGRCVDYLLSARSDMASLVDSLVAPMSLINALIAAVANRRRQEADATFAKLEEIWDEYHVYQKVNE